MELCERQHDLAIGMTSHVLLDNDPESSLRVVWQHRSVRLDSIQPFRRAAAIGPPSRSRLPIGLLLSNQDFLLPRSCSLTNAGSAEQLLWKHVDVAGTKVQWSSRRDSEQTCSAPAMRCNVAPCQTPFRTSNSQSPPNTSLLEYLYDNELRDATGC